MPIDHTTQVYNPVYDVLARPVTFTPLASQPGQPAYGARGIYSKGNLDIPTEMSVLLSDQATILDIIEREFTVLPAQGDRVDIPSSGAIPAAGLFEITDRTSNGGGETTLELASIQTARP